MEGEINPPPVPQFTPESGILINNRRRLIFGVGILLIAVVGIYFTIGKPFGFVGKSYSQIYTLVPDKISQSAAIVVTLPPKVPIEGAEKLVSFEPSFEGKWLASSGLENSLAFVPKKPLEIGKRYTAKLALEGGALAKDFVIDEDPKVLEVFPKTGSEADEHSAITIMFNRPMVPLTTLGTLEQQDTSVQITPETEGKFKWISTRTLQFIPAERLRYSARYSIKILPGFASTDGVPVPAAEYNFTTRPLRGVGHTEGVILYDQPIQFSFNEPINLERTAAGLSLKNNRTGALEQFEAEYGKRYEYDSAGKPTRVLIDRSVLSIYPKADRSGRARIWDFGGSYSTSLNSAYPLDGDIIFSETIRSDITITTAIKSVNARSTRSPLVSQTLFDPEGALIVGFYEDIDLARSDIAAKGLKKIEYGKKCKKSETTLQTWRSSDADCEKTDNKSEITISFEPQNFARGESFQVTFKKIVNANGLNINSDPLVENVTVYPELKIKSIEPDGSQNGSLTELSICTNSPLSVKEKTDYKEVIKTSSYLALNRFDSPYLRYPNTKGYVPNTPCQAGEYVNTVRYGLHPEKRYSMALSLEDVFGQKIQRDISFTTAKPSSFYSRFYNLQKIYNVTTSEKTKFTYGVENLEYVNLYICKVSPATMLSYLNQRPEPTEPDSALNCADVRTDTIELPKVYWVNNYFQIDLKKYFDNPKGQYVISFSAPNYKQDGRAALKLYDRTYVSVTDLAVGEKKTGWTKYDQMPEKTKAAFGNSDTFANLYWVSNVHTQTPVSGAEVRLFVQSGEYNGPIAAGTSEMTGQDGVARLPLTKDIVGAVVTAGDDSAIVSSWTDYLQWAGFAETSKKIYTYTDRPIYRPNQDVFVKGIYRFQFDGRYEIFKDKTIRISVKNPKEEEIMNVGVPLSEFGTFVTHLKLPAEATLGTYRIEVDDSYNYAFFEVEEYQGAAFETKVSTDKEEYVAGETAEINVSGKYYFGVPLAGGTLDYSFTSQDYYFDRYNDEYFRFGSDWYYCADCGYGDSFIGNGQTTLDIAGKAKVTKDFDFSKLFKNETGKKSKIIVFHGTIKDLNGKSVSFQRSFIVHRGDFYLGVKTEPSFAPTNTDINVRAKTVDTSGTPLPMSNIALTASKVEWKSAKRQEVDGGFYSNYERVLTPVETRNLSTGNNGEGSVKISFKNPGEYQISLISKDRKGNVITAESSTYIYGEGSASVQPKNNESLDVTAEKTKLEVGEKAKIIIKSPYPRATALISVERGRIFTYDIVTVDQNFYEYEVPIEEDYAPNVFVSVLLLSPEPEVKFGQLELKINTTRKVLKLDIKTDKTVYLPGERVNLEIKTTNYRGEPKPAEVSISVADLSVLALKGNPKKNPVEFFYNGLPLLVTTASNIKNILEQAEIPKGTKGGDGGNPADLAKRKRGEFKDTAFWEGQVVTNAGGTASISFTLPDNLTRWQIESVAITRDTEVGVDYKEFVSAKKVMAVPLAPRFVVPGDEFSIGVNVFNQTDAAQPLTVTLQSPSLALSGDVKQSVNLKAGESKTVYFKVTAPKDKETGEHTFTLFAGNGNFEDAVERTIPIKRNETYESVATSGVTKTDKAVEYVFVPDGVLNDRGGVNVRAQASMAFLLKDAIAYLAEFPYGCSEQMASKLGMLAVLKKANSKKVFGGKFLIPNVSFEGVSYSLEEAVKKGLARVYENQVPSGGFAYYQGLEPNLSLSNHILGVLIDLKAADFAVSEESLSRAAEYVANTLASRGTLYYSRNSTEIDSLIAAAYNLARLPTRPENFGQITNIIRSKVSPAYLSDTISSAALGHLALLVKLEPSFYSLEKLVWNTLDNRIDIDSRGAYLKSNPKNIQWEYYETPVKNTALLIKAIAKRESEHAQTDSLLRWLFAGRDKTGAWGSTNTTLAVIDAVTDYLDWSREGQSEFKLTLSLDNVSFAEHAFKADSLFYPIEKFIPISEFEQNKNHSLSFRRTNLTGAPANFYYDIGMKYYLPVENLPPRDEGIAIFRNYYSLADDKKEQPLYEAKVGDVLRAELRVITPKPRSLFAIESFIPAAMELVNFNLDTEDESVLRRDIIKESGFEAKKVVSDSIFGELLGGDNTATDRNAAYDTSLPQIFTEDATKKDSVQKLYPDFKEFHDDRLFLFNQNLSAGEYVYEYYVRVTTAGKFRALPAVASELYFPEIFGRTEGVLFTVEQ